MKTLFKHTLLSLVLLAGAFTAQAQVKIGSNPTIITPTSNLEVEGTVGGNASKMVVTKDESKVGVGTVTPTNKLHVISPSDPLKLEGVQPGAGNETLLTIDANGVVKKQPATAPVPTVRLTARLSADYNATYPNIIKLVPLDTYGTSDGNFSTTTHLYTVPITGTYQISGLWDGLGYHNNGFILSAEFMVLINSTSIRFTTIAPGGWPSPAPIAMAGSTALKLNAGDTVGIAVRTCGDCPSFTFTGLARYSAMTIVKLD